MSLDFFRQNNRNSIFKLEDRKNCINRESENLFKNQSFNPKLAKHRSNKGLVMRRNDFRISLAIQLIPLVLLTTYFVSRFFI